MLTYTHLYFKKKFVFLHLHTVFCPKLWIYPGPGIRLTMVNSGRLRASSATETDPWTRSRRTELCSAPSKLFRNRWQQRGAAGRPRSERPSSRPEKTGVWSSGWPCWWAAGFDRRSWRRRWNSCEFCGVLSAPTG